MHKAHPTRYVCVLLVTGVSALSCGTGAMSRNEFCEQLPSQICGALFDTSCPLPGLDRDDVRYASLSDCEAAESKNCAKLIDDAALSFDEEKAEACIRQVSAASCEESVRSEFHACDHVFDSVERPIAGVVR